VPGADAMAAPPLDHFYARSYIAGRLPNTEENLIKWIQDPQQIEPGNAMPNLGVTPDEARDIASYLYHEPALGDAIGR
jgi:cytochrome c1